MYIYTHMNIYIYIYLCTYIHQDGTGTANTVFYCIYLYTLM